jgi:5-methylcytosine-specific restriction enzyme A
VGGAWRTSIPAALVRGPGTCLFLERLWNIGGKSVFLPLCPVEQNPRMPKRPPVFNCRPKATRQPWDHGGKSRIERGYNHRWAKVRLVVLARDQHLCQPCRRRDRLTPATAADDIVPKAKGGTDELENLEATCEPCHQAKTLRDQGKRVRPRIGNDGWPID